MPRGPVALPLNLLVMDCWKIDPAHVHPTNPTVELSEGPIHVEALLDGRYFIHNGRHRTLRAQIAGETHIWAYVMNEADPNGIDREEYALRTLYHAEGRDIAYRDAVRMGALIMNGASDQPGTLASLLHVGNGRHRASGSAN